MSRPLALDLFSCAGGSAVGLERAGFDVIGIDHKPSQYWCGAGEVHEADLSTADAVEAVIRAFAPDFVSASPPCQFVSSATPIKARKKHPNLIPSTREGILRAGVPAWIENVETVGRHFTGWWVMLCGSMFEETYHLQRHRRFELHGWKIQQQWHNALLCDKGSDAHDAENCTLCSDFGEASGRRVAVAGKGPQGGLDRKREIVRVCGDGGGISTYAERQARLVLSVAGDSSTGNRGRGPRRTTVTVTQAETTPGFGNAPWAERKARARTCVGVFGWGLDGPGQRLGQNRAGPECIRWRTAMGWLDGPKNRYSLAQAIPPVYAEWLGRRFLETRERTR